MYWNTEHYNSVRLEVPDYGISNVTSQYINGQLYCKFTRDASTSIQVPNNPNNTHQVTKFDLNTKPFHILMAIGPVSEDDNTASTGTLKKHTKAVASEKALDFSTFNSYLSDDHSYDDCGQKYGCFGLPQNCISDRNCSILVTFLQLNNKDVKFELISKPVQDNR